MIIVVNKYTYSRKSNQIAVPIYRGTPLGNPYRMKTEDMRDYVCDRYRKYLNARIYRKDKKICKALYEIYCINLQHDVCLICSCTPKRCHGDYVKFIIDTSKDFILER